MKTLFIAIVLALTSSLTAQDITFKGADWDSPAIPLKLNPFYLTIESDLMVKSVGIEIDMYVKGKLTQTLATVKMSKGGDKTIPLGPLKCALYFPSGEGDLINATAVLLMADGSRGISEFKIPAAQFLIGKGVAHGALGTKVTTTGRIPVFYMAVGGGNFRSGNDPDEVIGNNPDSTVLIGHLVAE